MYGILMRISSSTEPLASNLNKNNNPLAFWLKKLSLPKPLRGSPPPRAPSLNVPHSRILDRLSYRICSTLAFWFDYCIESASLSHFGSSIVSHVPHYRILARCLHEMCLSLAFWLDFNQNMQIPIWLKIASVFSPDLHPASISPASSQHQASIQPASSQRPASVQPASSQRPASVQPASSQHLASIQPASSQRPASIQPASSQHPASIQPASSQHPTMHNKLCYPSF
jgi:hypothetical protein